MDKKISELTSHATPINADSLPIVDSDTSTTKRVTWANIKATLKSYFDTLYSSIALADEVSENNGAVPSFKGAVPVRIALGNAPSGTTDLYTVPTGKKLLLTSQMRTYNTTGSSITSYLMYKIAGNYYRLQTPASNSANTSTATTFNLGIVLEAGESIAINTTAIGLNVSLNAMLFDATVPLKTAKLLSLTTGDNTLYTVPAGKIAFVQAVTPSFTPIPVVCFGNGTAGSVIWYAHNVASGGTPDTTNRVVASQTYTTNTINNQPIGSHMEAGDFISINSNSSSAGQWAGVTVYEVDA